VLLAGSGQLWLRKSASSLWEYDVLLSPGTADEWIYKRDPTLRLPMAEALWERDGVRYIQPEIQLLYKAKSPRPKDEADFLTTLPHLDGRRRAWLREALRKTSPPSHPWLNALG